MQSSRPLLARLIHRTAAAVGATALLALAAPDAAISAPATSPSAARTWQPGRGIEAGGDRAESATDRATKKRSAKKRRSSRRGRSSRRVAATAAR